MSEFVITLDVDWATDHMIAEAASMLADAGVRSTWFVTHDSPAIRSLGDDPNLFERGIHPNFLSGSTQGADVESVLAHLAEVVPEAVSSRSHAVFQTGPLIQRLARDCRIRIDVTPFMPGVAGIAPFRMDYGLNSLLRVPVYWADDYMMSQNAPDWSFARHLEVPGLKVLAFHPIHIHYNFSDLAQYVEMRRDAIVSKVALADAVRHARRAPGVRTFFAEALDWLAANGGGRRIKDLLLDADSRTFWERKASGTT